MADQSSDQVRAEYVSKLGRDLGEVYYELWTETAWLHFEWRLFLDLYGPPETVAFLNETAGHFFGVVQRSLVDSIVLSTARLTGPPSSAGQANLSVRRLPGLVADPAVRDDLQKAIHKHGDMWKQLEQWRHKRIAHLDLGVALGTSQLFGPTVETITAATDGIADVMNVAARLLLGTEIAYKQSRIGMVGGVGELLHLLRVGKKRDDACIERLRSETSVPSDLGP